MAEWFSAICNLWHTFAGKTGYLEAAGLPNHDSTTLAVGAIGVGWPALIVMSWRYAANEAGPSMRPLDSYPDPLPCSGNCSWIHDPNIYVEDGTYYRFSTSGNIAIATAPDLTGPWNYQGALLHSGTSIDVDAHQDIWAPNINKIGSTYYAFYSVSTMGSQDSEIGLATSTSLDAGSWTDHGSLNIPKSPAYNLIDPSLFQQTSDSSTDSYFTFGSYWNGIYQFPMSSLTAYTNEPLTNILSNTTANAAVVEGAITFQWKSFYYLFFSSGQCCSAPPNLPNPGDEYRINVCRADKVEGPYADEQGRDCLTQSGGSTVLESHGDVYAPGGQGVLFDEKSGRTVVYYHYVNPSIGYGAGDFQFGANYLDFGDGWPRVVT
ncbi:glycoside hydrolase family 43 protein [Lophiostoma macrostomum CBS 122681]|uniref:Arabinan endo-1,5-alpha-L-arabinosidase n=1 Tax=Lophiostoma macrostomum CBS 122681 TaxID=1314788 RepID=A0A6A6THU2_9PLEO|nr:glycoside hydrolase family 43 protein [Lophiostoma macrostomum CBS 122681]